jgi:hypothetical protein
MTRTRAANRSNGGFPARTQGGGVRDKRLVDRLLEEPAGRMPPRGLADRDELEALLLVVLVQAVVVDPDAGRIRVLLESPLPGPCDQTRAQPDSGVGALEDEAVEIDGRRPKFYLGPEIRVLHSHFRW